MKNYAQELQELQAKHEAHEKYAALIPGVKFWTNTHEKNGGTVFITLVDNIAEQIAQIVEAIPPTENAKLTFAGKPDIETATPYTVTIENNIGDRDKQATLSYYNNGVHIRITLPAVFYNDHLTEFTRGVTNCEYHYFGGVPVHKIKKMTIRCKEIGSFSTMRYFGGNSVAYSTADQDGGEFARFALTGKTDY